MIEQTWYPDRKKKKKKTWYQNLIEQTDWWDGSSIANWRPNQFHNVQID